MNSRRSFLAVCIAVGVAPAIFVDGIARGVLMPIRVPIIVPVRRSLYVGKGFFPDHGMQDWFPSLPAALEAIGTGGAGQTIYVAHDHVEYGSLVVEASPQSLRIVGGI